MSNTPSGRLALVLLALVIPSGCLYDPPPAIVASTPPAGSVTGLHGALQIVLSEPVDAATLEVALWHQADRLFDDDGRLLPQCRRGETTGCAAMWFGPFRLDDPDLSLIEGEPCRCRVEQRYRGSRIRLEQECRAFRAYRDWQCRAYLVDRTEICREFVETGDGECRERMERDYPGRWRRQAVDPVLDRPLLAVEPVSPFDPGQYLLRLSPGLVDLAGRDTGTFLDLRFGAADASPVGETDFEPGWFITWLDLSEPFAYPLEVIWHFDIDRSSGTFTGSGCDADPADPATGHEDREAVNWRPWPYVWDGGYAFDCSGEVRAIESSGRRGYRLTTGPFNLYAGPPIEVDVVDGTIDVNIFHNERLGRDELSGLFGSPETYLFGSRRSGTRPDTTSGAVYGYRLTPAEVQAWELDDPAAWEVCNDPDDTARP